jgi:hypothetical protein
VIGTHETLRTTLDTINRILLKRIAQVVVGAGDSDTRETWLFLDEIRETQKVDGLYRLFTKSRSKGVSIALAAQGIEGIRDAFGDKVADELTSQCSNLSILGLNSPATAKWASEILGRYERTEVRRTSGTGGDSLQEQIVNRETVMPSELLALPSANPKNGIPGYHVAPDIGAWFTAIPGDRVRRELMSSDPDVPNFVPRPTAHQYLRPWDHRDLARLGLEPEADAGIDAATPRHPPVLMSRLRVLSPKR